MVAPAPAVPSRWSSWQVLQRGVATSSRDTPEKKLRPSQGIALAVPASGGMGHTPVLQLQEYLQPEPGDLPLADPNAGTSSFPLLVTTPLKTSWMGAVANEKSHSGMRVASSRCARQLRLQLWVRDTKVAASRGLYLC